MRPLPMGTTVLPMPNMNVQSEIRQSDKAPSNPERTPQASTGSTPDSLSSVLAINLAAYDILAQHYERSGAERAERSAWLRPLVARAARFDRPITLLDVGTADGHLAGDLTNRGFDVTGIDFSPAMTRSARKNAPRAEIIEDEFIRHDFRDQKFDLVLMVAFAHLFPAPWDRLVLEKAANLLTDRGLCLISTTLDSQSPGYRHKETRQGRVLRYRNSYTVESLQELVVSAGLEIRALAVVGDPMEKGKSWIDAICAKPALASDEILNLVSEQP